MAMIKLQNMTPAPYYEQSRDFQFIGRLYDVVLNSVKTNLDQIYNLPLNRNTDKQLMDLLAMTLGFRPKHNYNSEQLYSVCSALNEILRNKGSKTAIDLAVKAIVNADGIYQEYTCDTDINNNVLYVYIPQTVKDISLFKDLLDYILPAGMKCEIIRTFVNILKGKANNGTTEAGTQDYVRLYKVTDKGYQKVMKEIPEELSARFFDANNSEEIAEKTTGDVTAKNTVVQGNIFNSYVYKPEEITEESQNAKKEKK